MTARTAVMKKTVGISRVTRAALLRRCEEANEVQGGARSRKEVQGGAREVCVAQ